MQICHGIERDHGLHDPRPVLRRVDHGGDEHPEACYVAEYLLEIHGHGGHDRHHKAHGRGEDHEGEHQEGQKVVLENGNDIKNKKYGRDDDEADQEVGVLLHHLLEEHDVVGIVHLADEALADGEGLRGGDHGIGEETPYRGAYQDVGGVGEIEFSRVQHPGAVHEHPLHETHEGSEDEPPHPKEGLFVLH